jgi:hypothetical protein
VIKVSERLAKIIPPKIIFLFLFSEVINDNTFSSVMNVTA